MIMRFSFALAIACSPYRHDEHTPHSSADTKVSPTKESDKGKSEKKEVERCRDIHVNTSVFVRDPTSPWNGFKGRLLACEGDGDVAVVAMDRYIHSGNGRRIAKPNPPWPESYSDNIFGQGHEYYQVPIPMHYIERKVSK